MRISKILSVVSAAIICAGVTVVRAQDTPAQAAALAALKQKMSELDAQAGKPATPPPAATQPTPAPVTAAPSAAAPVPALTQTGNPAATAGTQKASKAAARAEVKAQKKAAAQAKADAQKAAAAEQKQKRTAQTAEAPKKAAPTTAEAKAQKSAKIKTGKKTTAQKAPPAKPEVTAYPGKALGFNPIEPPPPPVSAEKQAALHALLTRYMANEVTPDQYQAERKKILAGQ